MFSPETIQHMNRESAAKAAQSRLEPIVFEKEDLYQFPKHLRKEFPDLGDFRPKGWKLLDDPKPLFCDHSGWGSPNEPALTLEQLGFKLFDLHTEHPDYGYGIIEISQFQLYLGVFKRIPAQTHIGLTEISRVLDITITELMECARAGRLEINADGNVTLESFEAFKEWSKL